MRVVQDVVLVEMAPMEEKTESGLYLPMNRDHDKSVKGIVVEKGPGRVDKKGRRIPVELHKGDEVWFSKWVGVPWEIDGKEHRFIRESDISGVTA